jgi:hypothetical protein
MRRRELAIRSALGASHRELTISMLRRELLPVFLGLGVVSSWLLSQRRICSAERSRRVRVTSGRISRLP